MADHYKIEMENVSKSFGGVHALKGVSFRVLPGEIHALVGENGAGKSTLMKILSGAYKMDAGCIRIDGREVAISTPKEGKDQGIGIVYQEFELAPDLTVAENIFLDRLADHFGIIKWELLQKKSSDILRSLGFDINPKSIVSDLSVAYQQIVEIAKVLSFDTKILILDEPTAVLTDAETEKLFDMLMKLKQKGVSIIYISHRMGEVFRIADTITTLRDGEVTSSTPKSQAKMETVIEHMIGGKLSTMFPKREVEIGDEVLRVEGLSNPPHYNNVSFSVRRGEVLGIAGLVGSGRTEVLRAIFGADPFRSGKVFLNGTMQRIRSPHTAVKKGLALVPENRKDQGLVIDKSIKENITMANITAITGFLSRIQTKTEQALADSLSDKFHIKTDNVGNSVNTLSGGNQQKVVLAKWFNTSCDIILLDEPTRGVDVGAKAEIHALINEFAGKGLGVVMVSSESVELIGMCDRIVVMAAGNVTGTLQKEDISEINIMKLAVGGNVCE